MEISQETKECIEQVVFKAFADIVASQTATYIQTNCLHNVLAIEAARKCPQRSERLAKVRWRTVDNMTKEVGSELYDSFEACVKECSDGFHYPEAVVIFNHGELLPLHEAIRRNQVYITTN